ncbi:hypothetical protein CUN85_08770 [Methanolobus halotolerans]|uniref:Uncharacterized protein n=2 Tax=Methanolobus halotolerans TaxID=2052935 RepID=A0A4E0QR70_9EURY|nr:hypothetical protein CUN85_08770 [Methanolobus halotolerans]
METPAASPALIDETTLENHGWSQEGEIEYSTLQQSISDSSSISFNSTFVKYRNERLTSDIIDQTNSFKDAYNIPFDSEFPKMDAWISTNRITLPGGAKLPIDMISKMTNRSFNDMSEQNNIRNFSKIETRELVMKEGSVIYVSIYSGSASAQNSSLNVLGLVAAFGNEDSSTIVIGMTPNGSLPVNIGPVEADLFTIDGNKEIEEMLELIATIE